MANGWQLAFPLPYFALPDGDAQIRRGIADGFLVNYEIYLAESRLTLEGAMGRRRDRAGRVGAHDTSLDRNKLMVDEFYRVEAERPTARGAVGAVVQSDVER